MSGGTGDRGDTRTKAAKQTNRKEAECSPAAVAGDATEENTGKEALELALFPLKSVLFPGGRLQLQIFEQRYLDLVRRSLKDQEEFGICLVKQGGEVLKPGVEQRIYHTGTSVRIVDWDSLANGLLGVTVEAQRKFTVLEYWEEQNKQLSGSVRFSETDYLGQEPIPVAAEHKSLIELLQQLARHPLIASLGLAIDYGDLRQMSWRLSELLPIPVQQRQKLLELDDPQRRLEEIQSLVSAVLNNC